MVLNSIGMHLRSLNCHKSTFAFFFLFNASFVFPQPGDDIVFMAKSLEKLFLQKLSKMPQEEFVVEVTTKDLQKGKHSNAGMLHAPN